MKQTILFILFISAINAYGQKFPPLSGKLLNEETINLPSDIEGKFTLIGLAYSQKAEEELRTWYDPSIDKFILKSGMFDSEYDVNVYFVPMFNGLSKMTFEKSFKKVKQLTDEGLYKHVIFYKGDIKVYKQELKMDDKGHPVFLLLDPNANIIKRFSGRFKEAYFEELIEIIDNF